MTQDAVLEQIKSRLTLSEFISKSVPLKRRGHEFVGCCPFHQEKTPSFTVNDQKGFYHCFGCGAHGSIFDFLMFQQHLEFSEAVRQAAQLAGISLPQFTPKSHQEKSLQERLLAVLEDACQYFQDQLSLSGGSEARDYILNTRHLSPLTIPTFRLGYAPSLGNALKEYLLKKGYSLETIQQAGLLSMTDRGESYDKFRHRLMFPIQDRQGKVIGFGGRILGAGEPKYLNSPETPVFDKGKTLFNLHRAVASSQRDKPIVVVEGYMDVISLFQQGYERVVAPMGTALTEDQIQLLWKIYPEPLLCFDGDNAGQRAAHRTAEKVLPLLKAGFSLNFLRLPEGEDPDTLIQKKGLVQWDKMKNDAMPLSEVLWQTLLEGFSKKTPEKKALLQKKINQAVQSIGDPQVRTFYGYDLKNKFFLWSRDPKHPKSAQTPAVALKRLNSLDLQERILIATILYHPDLLEHVHEEFGCLHFNNSMYLTLQENILFYFHEHKPLEKLLLDDYLRERKLDTFSTQAQSLELKVHAPFIFQDDKVELLNTWKMVLTATQAKHQASLDLSFAKEKLSRDFSKESWSRFKKLKEVFSTPLTDEKDDLI